MSYAKVEGVSLETTIRIDTACWSTILFLTPCSLRYVFPDVYQSWIPMLLSNLSISDWQVRHELAASAGAPTDTLATALAFHPEECDEFFKGFSCGWNTDELGAQVDRLPNPQRAWILLSGLWPGRAFLRQSKASWPQGEESTTAMMSSTSSPRKN